MQKLLKGIIDAERRLSAYKAHNEAMHRQLIEYQAAMKKIAWWIESDVKVDKKLVQIMFISQKKIRRVDL